MEKLLRNHGELCVLRHNVVVINTRLVFLLQFLVSTSCHIIIIFKPSFDLAIVPSVRSSIATATAVDVFCSFFSPLLHVIFLSSFKCNFSCYFHEWWKIHSATSDNKEKKRYENSTPNRWNEQKKKRRKIRRTQLNGIKWILQEKHKH